MYIFDTNAAYYLIDQARTPTARLAILQERAEAGTLEIGLPPITVLELASRVVEDPSWFDRVKEIAQTLESLRPRALPDPEQRMQEFLQDTIIPRAAYEHWLLILKAMALAPDASALQRGFDDYKQGVKRSVDVNELARYRAEYERQYVLDMQELARMINPKYDAQILKGPAPLPESEQLALHTFFGTPEWATVFLTTMATRVGVSLTTDTGKLGLILKHVAYFRTGYESLGISMFCNGRHQNMKRKNDYNDIHQLLYINEFTTDLLVSDDDSGAITAAAKRDGKVITLGEFLAREANPS